MIKYSAIIPTKNGGKYLTHTVKSVLTNKYKDCEILISFNKSSDNSLKVIRKIDDKRIRIFSTPSNFSMSKHYEWILNKAKGKWIFILGDDDAISKNFFSTIDDYLEKCSDKNIEAISVNRANYYWNGVQNIYGPAAIRYMQSNKYKIINSKINLFKVLLGIMPYSKLPGLYVSGLVNRNLIEKIKKLKKNNKFFNEPNPDVYSALIVSSYIKKYLRIEKPLFWVGTSTKSVAYKLIMKKKKNFDIKYNDFLKASEKDGFYLSKKISRYFWHSRLPSAFLFSSFFNIPKNKKKNYFFDLLSLGMIGSDILDKKNLKNYEEKKFIKKKFNEKIKKSNYPFFIISILSLIIFFLKKKISFFEKNCFRISNYFDFFLKKKKYIYSTNRKRYKNIHIASKLY